MPSLSAPTVRALFDAALLLSLAAWAGALAAWQFLLAPALARRLGPDEADRLERALRPRLYAWGTTCGALALPALLGAPLSYPEYRSPWIALQAALIALATLAMLHGGNALLPAWEAAARRADATRLDRLHRTIRLLDLVALAAATSILVAFAFRPAPRTAGIIEPTPQQRARNLGPTPPGTPPRDATPAQSAPGTRP